MESWHVRKESNDQQSSREEEAGKEVNKGKLLVLLKRCGKLVWQDQGEKSRKLLRKCTLVNFGVENSCSFRVFGLLSSVIRFVSELIAEFPISDHYGMVWYRVWVFFCESLQTWVTSIALLLLMLLLPPSSMHLHIGTHWVSDWFQHITSSFLRWEQGVDSLYL